MTEAQCLEIWKKTNGHCHFCGDPISLRKRGYRRQRADGSWEVDHVVQRDKLGLSSIDNYLPACTSCNRLRWHRKGPQLRELLVLGIIAKREMERFSETGKRLIELRHRQLKTNQRRCSGKPARTKSPIDPVLKAQIRQEERDLLIGFLKKHRNRSFSARELRKDTGVPKSRVRQLLETSGKISIIGHGDRYLFQSRPPKRRQASNAGTAET